MKQRLWTPNWKSGSECRNENVALNGKQKEMYDGYEYWTKTTALNDKLKQRLWMPKLKKDGVIKCQNEKYSSERQTEKKWWFWTPN